MSDAPNHHDDFTPAHTLLSWEKMLMTPNKLAMIKEALRSTGIWGLIILALNALVFKEAPLDEVMGAELQAHLVGLIDGFGWFMAFFGRLTAKKPIITQHPG